MLKYVKLTNVIIIFYAFIFIGKQFNLHMSKPFAKRQILDCSKWKVFADDNFEIDKNGAKFYRRVENTEKRRNCSLRAISHFPTLFSKDLICRHVKGLVWERVKKHFLGHFGTYAHGSPKQS